MEPNAQCPATGSGPYAGGNPDPKRFGFVTLGVFDASTADFGEAVRRVAEELGRPVHYVDEQGYDRAIIAGAVVSGKPGSLAWVEYKAKGTAHVDVEFRLKARLGDRIVIDWEVETYNPFFGCRVGYLAWQGERVVMIYREKHHTYACSAGTGTSITRVKIADEWVVHDGQLAYRGDEVDVVERLSIPELARLAPLETESARAAGLLPIGFEEMNALRKQWRELPGPAAVMIRVCRRDRAQMVANGSRLLLWIVLVASVITLAALAWMIANAGGN